MDYGISGKCALVTGGTKGIGFAIAEQLANEGVRLVVSARDDQTLQDALTALRQIHPDIEGKTADVSKPDEIDALVEFARVKIGLPDILISNAGGPPAGKALDITDVQWNRAFELTLMANVRLARAVLPHMIDQKWGRIVNVTGFSIKQPLANLALSNALRAGTTGFAKTLSSEVAAHGITVNNVAPGYTATQRLEQLFDTDDARQSLIDTIPAKRFGKPEEVASVATFLTSQQAAYITGQTIVADGGLVGATY